MAAVWRVGCVTPLVLALALSGCGGAHSGTSTPGGASRPIHTAAGPKLSAGKPSAREETRLPPGVMARVGRNYISNRTVEHWIKVQADIQYQPRPTRPVPRGLVPKPPGFRDCIAYLAAIAREKHTRPAPGTRQLTQSCEQEHQSLLRQMLEKLIIHYWVKEEATRAGIAVTSRELNQNLQRRFPTKAELRRFLAFTGLRAADERLIVNDELLTDKWPRATLPVYTRLRRSKPPETVQMVGEVDSEVGKLFAAMKRRWTPKTVCTSPHLLPVCGA